jgi:two-component system sensor histidine kinase UhpB
MLVGFALLLYLGLKLILQKAISPLNESINQLQKLARNQYDGVLNESDIEEVSRINQAINDLSVALIDLEKSRQMLSARIISAQENERANISRELHDELGQKIAVIRLNTGYLGKILSQQDSALVALADINQAIKDIDTELKSLLARLKSNHEFHSLNHKTLKELLTELIEQWEKSPGQTTQFNYSINLGNENFNSNLSLTVFRITQEALTNIAKHAQAKRVDIKVWSDKRFIYWYIADNGIGIAENLTTSLLKGNGLSGLQERIWSIGGELLINEHNEDKCGLTLEAKIPISA